MVKNYDRGLENFTLSKSPFDSSFIHIYHFDISSLVLSRACVTHQNLAYDLAPP